MRSHFYAEQMKTECTFQPKVNSRNSGKEMRSIKEHNLSNNSVLDF